MLQFSIITITAFVAAGNECVKLIASALKKDWNKYLPIISLVLGLCLGIAGYFTPNVDLGNNVIEACFIGLSAGASATGVHQVGKQLSKKDNNNLSPEIVDTIHSTVVEAVQAVYSNEDIPEEAQYPETDPAIYEESNDQ